MNPAIKTAINIVGSQRNWALLAKFHSRPSISGFTTKQRYPLNMSAALLRLLVE